MYFIVLELIDRYCEDISEDLKRAVLYKTENRACAESFLEAFREGLRGFYTEYEGGVYNAFQAFIRASEELPEGLYEHCKEVMPYIPEVPVIEDGTPLYYSNKVLVFDFELYNRSVRPTVNGYYLKGGLGKCVTVAGVIASKVCDPAGEFDTDRCEELIFGKDLLGKGYEVLSAISGGCMDQLFIRTDICSDDGEPTDIDIARYQKLAKEGW